MSNAERLMETLASVFGDGQMDIDAALIDRWIEALGPITADDVEMLMQGTDEAFVGRYEGFDGLRAGWADWLATFERVRLEIQSVEEIGDNVLTDARQIGVTRHGEVEIEQPSAAVWKFRHEQIARVEFHLDRDKARRSAEEPL
jgi:ketosteroid isomerase-like protein